MVRFSHFLYYVSAQRGMSWKESLELRANKTYPDNGYYLSNQVSLKEMLQNIFLNFRGNFLTD